MFQQESKEKQYPTAFIKTKRAVAGPLLSILLILMVSLFALYTCKASEVEYTANYMRDGLNAAAIGGLVVDIGEFSHSGNLCVSTVSSGNECSYTKFCNDLKTNLMLDNSFVSVDSNIVNPDGSKGTVNVTDYIIYNVKNNRVYRHVVNTSNGAISAPVDIGAKGSVRAVDGSVIEGSSIYARLTFFIKGMNNQPMEISIDTFVDIYAN